MRRPATIPLRRYPKRGVLVSKLFMAVVLVGCLPVIAAAQIRGGMIGAIFKKEPQRMRPSAHRILFLVLALAFLAVGAAWGSGKSTNQSKTGLAFDTTHVTLGNVEQDSKGTVTFLAINYGALPIKVGPVNIVALQGGDTGSSLQETALVNPNGVYAIPI